MSERKRFRSVCFTLNNYTPAEVQHIKDGSATNFKYVVFQEERGANGTPHLQGYAQRAQPTEFNTWKRMLGARCHLEQSRGTPAQNREYCTKDTDRIPGTLLFEKGDIPVQGERNDLTAIFEAAKDPSVSVRDLVDTNGAAFIRYSKGILAVRSIFSDERRSKTKVFWFYGATGLGKSHEANRLAPNAFWKQNSPWWCGYDPNEHEDVVIDDYRCDFCKFAQLLRLFDFTKLTVEIKGGNVNFRAKRIFVSTPKSPVDTWAGRSEEDIQQLLRRIEVLVEFTPSPFSDAGRIVANKVFHKGHPDDLVAIGYGPGDEQPRVTDPPPSQEAVNADDASVRRTRPRVEAADEPSDLDFLNELDGFDDSDYEL